MPGLSIDGISSGLNTTEIIDAIMQVERLPAAYMEQQVAEKTNLVSTYKAFQAKLLALQTEARKLSRSSTFESTSLSVSDDTYLSATASGRVGAGAYDFQVKSLARNHQIASQGFSDQAAAMFGTGTITIGVGDAVTELVTIDSGNNSLTGIRDAINKADAGVRASIINDGSSSNPYRLVLTSEKTGVKNKINFTADLSGSSSLNFTTATFDTPEAISVATTSDAALSLGTTAAYTGTSNKTYTFTVAGSGDQTVGSDNIVIDWTDGTNSGSILVTQADSEIALVGDGADGLTLNVSAGQLRAGDTFEVGTFAPLLQQASDAKVTIGSSSGTGSPITITSATNTFDNLITGMSITVKKETPVGETVSVSTDIDTAAVKKTIQGLIDKFNDAIKFVDDQNDYDADTGESGVLLGDYSVQVMQESLRRSMTSTIAGMESKFNQLATIGIRTNSSGQLSIKDSSALENAIRDNLDEVINLFVNSGNSSSGFISFVSSTAKTLAGAEMDVDITQAATRGEMRGTTIRDPFDTPLILDSTNNHLRLVVDGVKSEDITLSDRSYESADELVAEIQRQIDNDDKIGTRGLTVEWVESGTDSGYLRFRSSNYGSSSNVTIDSSIGSNAVTVLGLAAATSEAGKDVAGTINGEEATGTGQLLKGKAGNETTDGLQIRVTYTEDDLIDGVEGTVTVASGIASRIVNTVDTLSQAGIGMLDRRISGVEDQIEDLNGQIEAFDVKMGLRRERLVLQYYAMEQALGQMNSIGDYLTANLASLNSNWKFNQD
ncbi:flagellar filament capping protein FliD [bacterium]|nr:flagellar filament capping protein FliD [bacterium]MCB2201588.1 flagellar filament capping protein FliD [bacterium]